MLNLSEIKFHIKSIQETKQITSAMELISIAKMRKSLKRYDNNLVYFNKVRFTLCDILQHSTQIEHKYLKHRDGKRTAYIVIASDKGMAGGYNINVLNLAWKHMSEVDEKYVFTVGHMAKEFFDKNKIAVDAEFMHVIQDPGLYDARSITENIMELYKANMLDEVYVVYTKMHSTVKQEPKIIKLLPVELTDFSDLSSHGDFMGEIVYEPNPKAVFDVLVPQYVTGLLYSALVQSSASEHCSRMLAMQNATKNANEMLSKLKVSYNRARQEKITQEISEIVGGQIGK